MLSRSVAYQFHVHANGVTRYGLSHEAIKSVCLPIPPLAEQAAIARFLDHADRRIRRYVRAKQQLITLLEEQKQALIHRTVTGQVDVRTGQPYPAYKPSGVEWLGDVPAHWERARLKAFLLRPMRNGLFKKKDAFGSGVPLVNVADIYHNSFQIDPASLDRVQTTPDEMSTYQVRTGDLLREVRSSLKLEGTDRSAVAIDCALCLGAISCRGVQILGEQSPGSLLCAQLVLAKALPDLARQRRDDGYRFSRRAGVVSRVPSFDI